MYFKFQRVIFISNRLVSEGTSSKRNGSISMPPPPRSRPARNIKANDICFYDDKSHVPGRPYRIEVSRNTNTGKETTSVRTVLDGFEFIR